MDVPTASAARTQNLPGFVVLISSGVQPSGGQGCWGSGFLPSVYQGVQCRSKGDPVLYVSDPPGMDRDMRRLGLDALQDLNELQAKELGHPETLTRISQYELAFRMQTVGHGGDGHLQGAAEDARRLRRQAGRGELRQQLPARPPARRAGRAVTSSSSTGAGTSTAPTPTRTSSDGLTQEGTATTDKPVAALIKDLKARGLLDDTLVIWGGEFGRTPFREGRTAGGQAARPRPLPRLLLAHGRRRRHQGGLHARRDRRARLPRRPKDKVHVHDLQATILHCLGFDHTKLTFRFQGRDYRLTDVHGNVVKEILA